MGYLYGFLAITFWGFNFVTARYLAADVPPATLTFWRWFVALLILAPYIVKVIQQRNELIKHWRFFILAAITGVSTFHICIYLAANTTSAYNLPLIAAFSGVFVTIFTRISGGVISAKQLLGSVLATIGLLILISKGSLYELLAFNFVAGDIWMLLAAAIWALYSMIINKQPKNNLLVNHTAAIIFAMPLLGYIFLVESLNYVYPIDYDLKTIMLIFYLALFPSVICYWLWINAIAKLGVLKAHAIYYLIPIVTAIEARLILEEELYLYYVPASVAIIVGAIFTTNIIKGKKINQ